MKTTIKINLAGQVFTLDEDAFQMLKEYLDSISKKFRDMEEGNEIITDIESRIAELFQQRIHEKKQVITIEDVKEVIEIMGHPEDFDEGEVVTVTLTTGIQSFGGAPLDSAFVWSFTSLVCGGTGVLSVDSIYPAGGQPYSVFAADLDGDGDLDLAATNNSSNDV